ncbi:Flp/Fap pilin component [Pseudomonas sp. M47T1]|uniref:Flp family type IVb pilin n=1 Tax=unclassified Pseudomonas TaxID=196821 RepID=UPI00026085CA|nr:Flp family type IVb pilin [Pseudomonas sp. M47T1]EIK96540.1 Flp/Fap pilin component [Pseudomonas sp. M47T1]
MSLIKFFVLAQLKVEQFIKETEGASGIEYAIIAAMVAVIIIGFSSSIQNGISAIFTKIQAALPAASS